MNENPSFWDRYNYPYRRAIDVVIASLDKNSDRSITPQVATEFALGCRTIYTVVEQIHPTTIVLPLRGASPIGWAIEEMEQMNGRNFPKFYPRIGSHTKLVGNQLEGYKWFAKRAVLEEDLANYLGGKDNAEVAATVRRPLLIDEVQQGSTLTQASQNLFNVLHNNYGVPKLYVIAAQDKLTKGTPKNDKYRRLIGSRDEQFEVSVVNLPLFHVDRPEMIDYLLVPDDAPVEKQPFMQHVLHNEDAEAFIKNIVHGTLYPNVLLAALYRAKHGVPAEVAEDFISKGEVERITNWILDMTTHENASEMQVSNESIYNWLEELASLGLTYR